MLQQSGLLQTKNDHIVTSIEKSQKYSNPFEIVIINVPKNFIRKLVGYQEKMLSWFRKRYFVEFDFNRDLLVDEVF